MPKLSQLLARAAASTDVNADFDNAAQIVLDCLLRGRVHQAALMNGFDDDTEEVALVGLNRKPLEDPSDFQTLIDDLQHIGH